MAFVIPNPFQEFEENLSSEQDPIDDVFYGLEQMSINENPFDDKFIFQFCRDENKLIFEIFESPLERTKFDEDASMLDFEMGKDSIEKKIETARKESFEQNKDSNKEAQSINNYYSDLEGGDKLKRTDKVVEDTGSEWSSYSVLESEDENDVVVQAVSSLSQCISRTWKRILLVLKPPKV